jgi:hypothetical protein
MSAMRKNAESAEVTQGPQRKIMELAVLCGFCVTSAASALKDARAGEATR